MSEKNGGPVSFSLEVTGTDDAVTAFCIAHLKDRGYAVAPPNSKWEALGNFMQRIGISNYSSITRSIQYWLARGETLPIHRSKGGTGRIIELLSNPAFDEFCQRNKS